MKISKQLPVLSLSILASILTTSAIADDLTVWAWDPNFNVAAMHEAAGRYKQQVSNFELEVIDSAREDIEQKLHIMLASGIKTSLPDIVLIEDYNAQKFLTAYPGSFLPLQEHINYNEFAPYKVKVMTLNDKIYGIPFDSGVAGLFYRTDYLEKAGFKHEDLVNITWDRFIEIGKVVKEKTGVAMLTYDINDVVLPHIMMQSGGEWYVDEQGKLNLSENKALIKTLETIKAINDAEITRPISGWSSFVGSFNSGLSATVISGVWIMGSIKSVEEQSGLWKVAPIPRLNIDNATHTSNQGGSSWYVLSTSDDQPLAIDFLKKTFASDQDMYQTLLVERGALATYLPASTGYAYTVNDPFFSDQPVFSDFSKWVREIPQVPYGMYTQEIDTAIASEIPAILKGEDIKKVLSRVEQSLKYQGI